MNTQPPLLPETTFKPLSHTRLEAMIAHAVTHKQEAVNNVVAFRRPWAATVGLGAMAASIMLAFMVSPQYTTVVTSGSTGTDIAQADTAQSDVSDLLLLESFGA